MIIILPSSFACNCSSNDGIGGDWNPPLSIAFIAAGNEGYEIYRVHHNGTGLTKLTYNVSDKFDISWSPDGSKIAYVADDGQIYLIGVHVSGIIRLTNDTDNNTTPTWSPDGTKIVYISYSAPGNNEIYIIDADGSNQISLTGDYEISEYKDLTWSPDGSRIAFLGSRFITTIGLTYDLYCMDVDGSNLVNITDDPDYRHSPAWSPDGTEIAFYSNNVGAYEPGFEDGLSVVHADFDRGNVGGTRMIHHLENNMDVVPQWSPDGSKIAFFSDRFGDEEIYILNVSDYTPSRIINISNNSEGNDRYPAWSPNGAKLAFASDRDGDWDIYVVNADGSGQTYITNSTRDEYYPVWSP
ncbi:hypothetical protein ACFLXN_00090 [Chloroflexota bacterium]